MNDKDIIMALRCCSEAVCGRCPLRVENMCVSKVTGYALDLIKRQQAEIEELRRGFTDDMDYFASEYDSKIKAEAIKEFAERLKIDFGHGVLGMSSVGAIIETKRMPCIRW